MTDADHTPDSNVFLITGKRVTLASLSALKSGKRRRRQPFDVEEALKLLRDKINQAASILVAVRVASDDDEVRDYLEPSDIRSSIAGVLSLLDDAQSIRKRLEKS